MLTIISICSLKAQSNVDRLVQSLDSLCTYKLNDWKVSPDIRLLKDLKGDPSQQSFDDSQWQNLTLNQSIYPDSCWMRKEIVLPERFLGKPISGQVSIRVSVDDYGYMFINGEKKGMFPWDGEFVLTNDAKPGQHFFLAIKAINTGGPLRLIRAALIFDSTKAIQQLVKDYALSLRVGQKLLSFDTYQSSSRHKVDPKIDNSPIAKKERTLLSEQLQSSVLGVDVQSLVDGRFDVFMASLQEARERLKPINTFAKQFTLYFTSNAHIDASWLWRDLETQLVCKNTFGSVFNMMNARQDFTYTQSSAAYYDWMERLYPDVFTDIKKRVKDGRWEIVGGMWIEPDCNLISGESWNRQLLYSARYFKEKFGDSVKIGWNPDSFGYTWNMPQFYLNAGYDAFITQKIGWNETTVFPHRVFWWEAPNGSRILTYFPFDYVNTIEDPYQIVDWLRQFEANTGFEKMMVLFGVGDHGGGPSLEMMSRIDHLKTLDIFPTIEFGNAGTYLDWLHSQNLASLPVLDDELYLEYHQGTYTTQANMKKLNRKSEVLLTNAEKFSTLSTLYGNTYHSQDLEEAWRKVMFNQFHDILPGSGIRETYLDATEKYQEAETIGNVELTRGITSLGNEVNTSTIKGGAPVHVFNQLSWSRNDIAMLQLPFGDTSSYSMFDTKGNELATQTIRNDKYNRTMMFRVDSVPSVGYATYVLKKQATTVTTAPLAITKNTLENEFFKITVDTETGWIKSIVDKRNGKELLAGPGNRLQLLEDKPKAWDAWNVGLTGVEFPSTFRSITIAEEGPVRIVLRITRDYLKPGVQKDFPTENFPSTFFTQDIILYAGVDRIDFKTDVDWWESKTMLKVAFPLTVSDTSATYEIPYGTIKRTTQWRDIWDSAKVEVPAMRWADLSNQEYGVSLLNNSKYGYDVKGSVLRLSLLRSPEWPDPTADRGKHSIEYSLFPHAGRVEQSKATERGYEFNYPLLTTMGTIHKGKLPLTRSFVQLTPDNLVLTSIKKAEDSDAWMVQWYDAKGIDSDALLTLPQTPSSVVQSNFIEENGIPLQSAKNSVKVKTEKNSIITIKVIF